MTDAVDFRIDLYSVRPGEASIQDVLLPTLGPRVISLANTPLKNGARHQQQYHSNWPVRIYLVTV